MRRLVKRFYTIKQISISIEEENDLEDSEGTITSSP